MKPTPVLLALVLFVATPVAALEWHTRGPRALGMGGAGVASAQGPLAAYWNPGALGRKTTNGYGGQVPVGGHVAMTGDVYQGAIDLRDLRDRVPPPTPAEINAALNKLDQPGNGVRFDADGGAYFRSGRIGLFVTGSLDGGAQPVVDRANTTAADIQGGANNSRLILKGVNILEFGIGYGHELPFAPGLYAGGALKLMSAKVGYAEHFVLRDGGDIVNTLRNSTRESSNVGVDAGALWDLDRSFDGVALKPRLGIVARNLNNPKFKQPDAATRAGHGDRFTVNPQVRLGASITPFSWWNLAADVDLTRNLTPVDNAASRQFGVGNEFNIFNRTWINIPLRVGLMRNTAETSAGTMFTSGIGINMLHFVADLSAAASNRELTTAKGDKIPREASFGLQIGVLFGGVENDAVTAPRDDQPTPTSKVRAASEKAHDDLKVEELKKKP